MDGYTHKVRFDMHCHTAEGSPDAKVKIVDYTQLLKQRGFHGMLVTDHDSYNGFRAYLSQKEKVKDFIVLRGIEYDTFDYGHFLIVLPSDTPEEVYELFEHRGMALIRVIWLVHECGGIIGPAHPFGEKFMSFGSTRRLGMIEHRLYAQHFDFIEGYNCCESDKRNKMARRLAAYYDIPVFGGSDAHKENCVGLAGTYLPENICTEDDLINYINDGNHPEVGGRRYPKTLKDKIGPAGKFLTYGFYLYKNDLFKISPEKAEWENDKLIVIPPRYSSASVIVDDHLYIFGGRGCKTGKQELNPHIYYDLYSVNLKTKETKLIRQFKEKRQFLPCGNMIYNSADSCFYVLTNWQKGTLFKISLNHADLQEASSPINQSAIESDYTFYTLFHSERDSKLYALFCKNFKTGSSDISIFEINYPPIAQSDIVQEVPDKSAQLICWGSYIGLGIVLLSLIAIYIYRKKKRKSRFQDMSHETDAFEQPHANKTKNNSRQCINLLGGFNIIDKEGRDITVHFTPILKNLLLLILLYSENDGKGINSKNIEAILWPDKEEKSARNNRNVSITRLKTLLSEIGNIQLYNDNRFWKLTLGEDVSCDYYRVLDQMRKIKEHPELKERLLPEVLDYLMLGPLLPHTQIDWVDKFKSDYTSLAIDFLNRLLQENDSNDVTKLQLTDVIFLYDSLNEDALTMKCYILYNSGKKGLAKNTYDNFCKEYFSLLGEKYKYSLAQILEFAEHQDKVKHT